MSREEQLAVCWRFHAGHGALIWQLMFTETGDLVGQKRFAANRRTLFFCIDIATGQVLRDDYLLMDHLHPVPAGDGWLVGLETTLNNLVYCYAYQSQSPEHKGIWALDLRCDRVVWSRSDIVFAANLNHEFLVYQRSAFGGFPERHFLLIDPFTGKEIRQLGIETPAINVMRQQLLQEEERQQVTLPEFVTQEMSRERLALQRAGISEKTHCECIVQGPLTVAALHEQDELNGLWHSRLNVLSMDCLLYEESMEVNVEKPSLNNFLIRGTNLYYLKDKEELVCVALS